MNEQAKAALHTIDEKAAYFTAISDAVWDDPELSLKEFHAAALYKNALRELGFSVQENLCGIETAFSGSYGAGRPVIEILGEFDALSGLSQQSGAAALQSRFAAKDRRARQTRRGSRSPDGRRRKSRKTPFRCRRDSPARKSPARAARFYRAPRREIP